MIAIDRFQDSNRDFTQFLNSNEWIKVEKKVEAIFASFARKFIPSPNRHTFVIGLKLCDEFARAMMPP